VVVQHRLVASNYTSASGLMTATVLSGLRPTFFGSRGSWRLAWPPHFPSHHSSGHRMAHFEFGQDRLTRVASWP